MKPKCIRPPVTSSRASWMSSRSRKAYMTGVVAPVHVADDRLRADDPLPVDTDEHPEHAVGRGVLGADVEDHLLGVEASRAGEIGRTDAREVLGDRAHQARLLIAAGPRRRSPVWG